MQKTTIAKALVGALAWLIGVGAQGWLADGNVTIGELLLALAGTPLAGYAVWRTPYYAKDKGQANAG